MSEIERGCYLETEGNEQEIIRACGIRDQGKKRDGCCVVFT